MKELLADLIDAINYENELLDKLSDLGYEKKQLIILGKVQELDNLIHKEGIIISELEKKEDARFRLQQQINAHPDFKGQEVSASILLQQVQQTYADYYPDMEQAVSRLDFNMTRLKAQNAQNSELIEQSLDYLAALEAVINGDVAGIYSRKGQQMDQNILRARLNLLDKKV